MSLTNDTYVNHSHELSVMSHIWMSLSVMSHISKSLSAMSHIWIRLINDDTYINESHNNHIYKSRMSHTCTCACVNKCDRMCSYMIILSVMSHIWISLIIITCMWHSLYMNRCYNNVWISLIIIMNHECHIHAHMHVWINVIWLVHTHGMMHSCVHIIFLHKWPKSYMS